MLNDIIFYLFMAISMIHITHIGMYIIGANMYDIWQFMRYSKPAKKRRYQPLVSVIVPAHNEESGIIKTLDSIQASTYRKVEIVVVDDGSTDKTAAIVRRYIRAQEKFRLESYVSRHDREVKLERRYVKSLEHGFDITLVRQRNTGKGAAVNNGIRHHAKGVLVMTLDADSVLDKHAIARAVRYFEDKKVVGVAANVQVLDDHSILGILQKIEHLIGYRTKKFFTATNCEFVVGGVASTYRMRTLKEVGFYDTDTLTEDIGLSLKIVARKGNRKWRIVYAADVLAGTQGVQSYKALFKQRYRWKMGMLQNLIKYRELLASRNTKYSWTLKWYRLPMAFIGEAILLIEPVLMAYVIYLSITHATIGALWGAYSVITLYVLWNLLPDEHLTIRQKIKYSLLSPIMYFIFYIMNAVQVTAVVRCLRNHKLVTGEIKSDGRWASPERAIARAH